MQVLESILSGNFCNSKRMVHFKEIQPDGYNIHFLRKYSRVRDSVLRRCSKRSWWWYCEVATSSGFKQLLMLMWNCQVAVIRELNVTLCDMFR
jgi:hypothetical protein